jgi:hypothetical protein
MAAARFAVQVHPSLKHRPLLINHSDMKYGGIQVKSVVNMPRYGYYS